MGGRLSTPAPLLEIRSLSKCFPGQVALDNVALTVRAGTVHALVGQNGSGKSTLIKVLAGFHRADPGADVRLDGRAVDLGALNDVDRRRIHVMHQDLGLVGSLDAVENLALGRGFATSAIGRVRWKAERARATTVLASLGTTFDPRLAVAALAPAERSVLALARALQDWGGDAGLLVLDEPTASLARPEVDRLFVAVRRVRDRGAGVIFVSHRLEEVDEIADDVTVLRDGVVVASRPLRDLPRSELLEHIVGRRFDPSDTSTASAGIPSAEGPVLAVRGLRGEQLEALDFDVRAGEIVGIAGLIGSGREELPALLFGAQARLGGTVTVAGRRVPTDPHAAITAGMALVPADRARLGSIPGQSVRQNITLPRLGPLTRRGRLRARAEASEARSWADRVELRPPQTERPLQTLSGGNQQKAVLARWLRVQPRVLVLDEPTQGVDVGAKATIHDLVVGAAASGAAVVVASSDAEELAGLCTRVIVMRAGRIGAELRGDALSAGAIVHATMHHMGSGGPERETS